jgi:hypothetical protein
MLFTINVKSLLILFSVWMLDNSARKYVESHKRNNSADISADKKSARQNTVSADPLCKLETTVNIFLAFVSILLSY